MDSLDTRTCMKKLDDTWLRASALGCLWASSEIVLGGFLHHLRIPFAGNIMAVAGIVLMVAVGHLWPVRGLFWRAGLVCALMKALAPTGLIFGPLLAISFQALVMEFALRIMGMHTVAYLLGAMLAMSWNVVQFLLKTYLSYGTGAVDIYLAMVAWAQKNLGLPAGRNWLPVVLMLLLQLVFGLAAGCLGVYVGRKAARETLGMSSLSTDQVMAIRTGRAGDISFSFPWLFLNLFLLVLILVFNGLCSWYVWLPTGLAAILVWIRRYRNAVRPLLRMNVWIWFLLITVLSGALLGSIQNGWVGLLPGLGTGLAMNVRAVLLLVGFSALGVEMRSPRLGRFLTRGKFSQLPAALEAAVETLPWVMANLPRLKETFRRPVTVFHQLVAQADFWLKRLTLRQAGRRGVLLLYGQVGGGKSGILQASIEELVRSGLRPAGILSPSVVRDGERIGYDLVDIGNGERIELSRVSGEERQRGRLQVGRFIFREEGLQFGHRALSLERCARADLVLVDEVGPWELSDQGWAGALYELTLKSDRPMIWVVRSDILDKVVAHWGLEEPKLVDFSAHHAVSLAADVQDWLGRLRECGKAAEESGIPPDGRRRE